MTPDQVIAEAAGGQLRPVYVITGEERLLVDRAVHALRVAANQGGIAGFNEDKFTAGEASIDRVISAAKMLPMMAKQRLVLVRGLERWEAKKGEEDEEDARPGVRDASPLDQLAEYAKDPSPSTVLVLVATKLHGQRRLVTGAKKGGYLVLCEPLHRRAVPGWIEAAAREKGHPIAADVSDLLAEVAGTDLAYVNDALERLSLYVGPGRPITEEAISAIVVRVSQRSVWELFDALGARRLDRALAALADVYDPRDGGLRLLGTVSWSVRQIVKFDSALRAGCDPGEAAQRAGVPPFKVREVTQVVKSVPRSTIESWLRLMAEADLALKGSKRPAQAILETMIIAMCA